MRERSAVPLQVRGARVLGMVQMKNSALSKGGRPHTKNRGKTVAGSEKTAPPRMGGPKGGDKPSGRRKAQGDPSINWAHKDGWKHFQYLKAFDSDHEGPITLEVGRAYSMVSKGISSYEGCVLRYLCAAATTVKQVENAAQARGATSVSDLAKLLKKSGQKHQLFKLVRDGDFVTMEKLFRVNAELEGETRFGLLVSLPGFQQGHILHLNRPNLSARVFAPNEWFFDDSDDIEESWDHGSVRSEESESGSEDDTGAEDGGQGQPAAASSVQQEAVAPEDGDFVVVQPPVEKLKEWEKYEGMFPCPENAQWVDGWWPLNGQKAQTPIRRLVETWSLPHCVSATPEYAAKYGDRVQYLPPTFAGHWFRADIRTACDGSRSTKYFTEGDALVGEAESYIAERVPGSNRLRLVKTAATIRNWVSDSVTEFLGLRRNRQAYEVVPRTTDRLPSDEERIVHWTFAVQSEKDPRRVAALQRLRQKAAAGEYAANTTTPAAAKQFVSAVSACYPQLESVAGPFGWGYCYSCGKTLPGRFKQRLCEKCHKRNNTGVGGLVANGDKVCSPANPVVYPGVVNTPTRHPPLKPGTETSAGDSVFR